MVFICDVRRCHDQLKAQYTTKKHSSKAWQPLQKWLFDDTSKTQFRISLLTTFKKEDDDLHHVVAKSLLRLAHGANHPWGVPALKPRDYCALPTRKPVCT